MPRGRLMLFDTGDLRIAGKTSTLTTVHKWSLKS